MAAKPLTTEAIALTEKKMDMSLGIIFFLYFKHWLSLYLFGGSNFQCFIDVCR